MSADYGRSGSGWSCCLCQVVELLQTFSLYTEHLDPSTAVKPDVDDRMWLLTADRTPYHEGLLALPLSCLQSLYCNYCCLILFVSPSCEAGTLSLSLVHLLPHLLPFLLFPFFHWLYLFSSFVHPFPLYQNSPTPFPGRRS